MLTIRPGTLRGRVDALEVQNLLDRRVLVVEEHRRRPRYFDGRFLAARDLTRDQSLFPRPPVRHRARRGQRRGGGPGGGPRRADDLTIAAGFGFHAVGGTGERAAAAAARPGRCRAPATAAQHLRPQPPPRPGTAQPLRHLRPGAAAGGVHRQPDRRLSIGPGGAAHGGGRRHRRGRRRLAAAGGGCRRGRDRRPPRRPGAPGVRGRRADPPLARGAAAGAGGAGGRHRALDRPPSGAARSRRRPCRHPRLRFRPAHAARSPSRPVPRAARSHPRRQRRPALSRRPALRGPAAGGASAQGLRQHAELQPELFPGPGQCRPLPAAGGRAAGADRGKLPAAADRSAGERRGVRVDGGDRPGAGGTGAAARPGGPAVRQPAAAAAEPDAGTGAAQAAPRSAQGHPPGARGAAAGRSPGGDRQPVAADGGRGHQRLVCAAAQLRLPRGMVRHAAAHPGQRPQCGSGDPQPAGSGGADDPRRCPAG
ncbi:MAG: hypothetical protein MZV63_40245 [Marinilabiliales bacterium]|nr:hypothetical protein [Marinilabiliales bacterium]